ncbi:MAG: carboxypeptidase-like regulatory domain-containing protein, partial [Acidobacteriota bacterium]|nr:carboxypeptidase-like regulatory domain-containing protein [Acidobacteriota bacterium]
MAVSLTGIVFAQASDAEITGLIKDPSGAPVTSTVVTLINQDSGFTRTTTADGDGRYRFVALTPGRYSLKTEATGFKPETVTGIVLNIGTHVDRDLSLSVGSVLEAVTVVGDVPPIDTTRSDISGVVTTKQIETLPVNTRQYLNLALLMPGTTQDASRTFYNNVQVGGGDRFYANGFLVDGVTNTWAEQGEPRQNFPAGSVQEFQVKTNQFKAEQGLAMGGLVSVATKSGTNEFHGDAFEYYRAKFLNRDNKFQQLAEKASGTGKAPFLRNQYGFDLGGPIIRNRLHFFAAFERTQTDSAYTIFTGA